MRQSMHQIIPLQYIVATISNVAYITSNFAYSNAAGSGGGNVSGWTAGSGGTTTYC